MSKICIEFNEHSYSVLYTNSRGAVSPIGYGHSGITIEEHAHNLFELALAMQSDVDVEIVRN